MVLGHAAQNHPSVQLASDIALLGPSAVVVLSFQIYNVNYYRSVLRGDMFCYTFAICVQKCVDIESDYWRLIS